MENVSEVIFETHQITDVNECERGIAGCNVVARCENYLGSVGCKCPQGFIGNGIHCIGMCHITFNLVVSEIKILNI